MYDFQVNYNAYFLDLFNMNITLDTRVPFSDSVGWIIPGPATTQKVYWNGFPAGGATMIDSFAHVD